MDNNVAVLAAAGSAKTQYIVDSALAVSNGCVLITTYTNENRRQIEARIEQRVGVIPAHIKVMGWFAFLISHCAKPYQSALTREPLFIRGLNFKGRRKRCARKSELAYFLDSNRDLWRDGVSDFAVIVNEKTNGAVVARLQKIFTHIFVDEVQDLVGYDLDVLDLLLRSRIKLLLVGDPRQCTYLTNYGARNKKYQGAGLAKWFAERSNFCSVEYRDYSHRCNQAICDFADGLYPGLPPTKSVNACTTGHDGIFKITRQDATGYIEKYDPVTVLRHNKKTDTAGLPAMNIGVAKGSTFDRVMIFPTKPMLRYLEDGDETKLKDPERLYVAVTRARYSVAFVVPEGAT